jgi:SnoaL-like domain
MANTSRVTIAAMDLQELRAVVDGIDSAVDVKDWARCRAYFADRLTVNFGEPAEVTADSLVAEWAAILHPGKLSHHTRSHHEYAVDGDTATVRSHAYIINVLDRRVWELWSRFTHRLAHTASGWECTGMDLTVVHTRGDDDVRTHRLETSVGAS